MLAQTIPAAVQAKEEELKALLENYGALAIAYSGGVDSAYLSCIAHEVLCDNARLILADSPSIPRSEVRDARALAEARGWNLTVVATTEFEKEDFLKNDGTRCYYCKDELFNQMDAYAKENEIQVLAYGELAEDRLDPTRLGVKAAHEHAVVAPLAEVGLEKEEIRRLSRVRELPTWNKASFACLSSRFPTGARVVPEEMKKVEAAEEILKGLGFRQYRARHHGTVCRVEIDAQDIPKMLDEKTRRAVLDGITQAGYRYVTLDLAGYRTGSTADLPPA
jgi:pyridinium-3,5-biscarboxylic acid mononucleotide sulfurtransferase